MKIIGIIPARMASTRFPGKPLVKICGIPMLGHVYYRSKMAEILNDVYVATCDHEIEDYINSINGKVVMTSLKHERASDRTAEALLSIEKKIKNKIDIVVMLQGDEPMIVPEMIDSAVEPFTKDSSLGVVNLMSRLSSIDQIDDPNEVKLVVNNRNEALYFSREPIPSRKKFRGQINAYKQVAVIPFRRDYLMKYVELDPTPLEIIESVDMNRFLENNIRIKMVLTEYHTLAVDTVDDLKNVENYMQSDKLIIKYLNELG